MLTFDLGEMISTIGMHAFICSCWNP